MRKTALVILFALISTTAFSQGEKLKATYLYQFAKILQWPNLGNAFTIGVWGDSGVSPILNSIASSKQIGARSLVIKEITATSDLSKCQIVFLSAKSAKEILVAQKELQGKHVLLVTDRPGMIKAGAGINFLMANGKVLYELSKANIANQGLVSVQVLEKLAHKVY
ncbi:MAG: YfiR family protein [Reichenbachiella sp.]|uniref:YfiR family protein n=1 Tax=Reichenbachiella sp. TaxID=2184521 RepID=UPI003263F1B7